MMFFESYSFLVVLRISRHGGLLGSHRSLNSILNVSTSMLHMYSSASHNKITIYYPQPTNSCVCVCVKNRMYLVYCVFASDLQCVQCRRYVRPD